MSSTNKIILEAKGISKYFGTITALENVNLSIKEGECLGVVGDNGAGKSTLMKIMSGFDDGFEGEFLVDNVPVKLGTPQKAQEQGIAIAQQELSLIPALTVAENIFIGGDHGPTVASLGQLSKMARPFLDEVGLENVSAKTLVNRLSIGERQLVEVARLIAHKPNLLILDEPTNDLDIETLDLLQDVLGDYDGTVLLVSHDRDFLDRVATTTIALEEGGEATVYAGGWSDYQTQKPNLEQPMTTKQAAKQKTNKSKADAVVQSTISFTEKYRLEALPAEIEQIESEISKLEVFLGQPNMFTDHLIKFKKATDVLFERRAALTSAEAEWINLEEKVSS